MSDTAIRVDNLSKRYKIGKRQQYRTIRETLINAMSAPSRWMRGGNDKPGTGEGSFWALKDVSFEVNRGDVVGIIGRNGAGKSTLLKVLSRITEPTEGSGEIFGRVGSLLEVGTGFHAELTGRENIYLNGAILGMKRGEIQRKFDEIVSFSEVEKFLDTPVKHYSSGMYMRLAFAVAAHLEPEILIVDEVLAVGDAQFQKKCLGKMGDVAKEGRTILFVSHNMAAIENLCNRAILMDHGSVTHNGPVHEVVHHYLEDVLPASLSSSELRHRRDRSGNGKLRLTSFHIEDTAGTRVVAARSGMDVDFVFGYESPNDEPLREVDVGLSISTDADQMLFVLYGAYVGGVFGEVPRRGQFRCRIPRLPLAPGRYTVGARVTVGKDEADWPWSGVGFMNVEGGDFYGTGSGGFGSGNAPILVSGRWDVVDETAMAATT